MTIPSPMAAPLSRRRRRYWLVAPILPIALVGGAMWWLTEPLEDRPATAFPAFTAIPVPTPPDISHEATLSWPEGRMEGAEAKRFLLAVVTQAAAKLGRYNGYTAVFRKQERIHGVLLAEQTMDMKVRNHPFAIYLKFLTPKQGKEVVFAEGHHDNKLIAHNGDWTRRLVPRLALAPDSALALADCRHPITEAGLLHLVQKLVEFREKDLVDADAGTILDRIDGEGGRRWPRSIHTHTIPNPDRPFARVEVLYDPDTLYPVQIDSYDWPRPGHTGDLELAERYAYDDIRFDTPPSAIDFDPANPAYAFLRF